MLLVIHLVYATSGLTWPFLRPNFHHYPEGTPSKANANCGNNALDNKGVGPQTWIKSEVDLYQHPDIRLVCRLFSFDYLSDPILQFMLSSLERLYLGEVERTFG